VSSARPKRKFRKKRGLRFTVVVEFLAGLVGIYGVGRLVAGRFREARCFLLASILLILPIDLSPRLAGDKYAVWVPWVVRMVLAAGSAVQLELALRAQARAGGR
jgi:hypothetical protein